MELFEAMVDNGYHPKRMIGGENLQKFQAGYRKHVPELDGFRGIAIVVVLFHHFVRWRHQDAACLVDRVYAYVAETGWFGVDLFFVLSGYLITGILFDAKGDQHFFRNFYARRVLRIFPLYYFVLSIIFFIFPVVEARAGVSIPVSHPWSYWLYLANFTIALPHVQTFESLIITWSLSIEEQFYIVWPAIIFFCSRRQAIYVACGLMVIAILVRCFVLIANINPIADYYWTPCHVDGLAVGACIAMLRRGPGGIAWITRPARLFGILGVSGMFLIAISSVIRHVSMREDALGQVPLYTCVAMFAGWMLIEGINESSFVARMLRLRVLRFFGKYSYGIYLYHAIVMIGVSRLAQYSLPSVAHSQLPTQLAFLILNTVITVAIAMLSWNLIERQFLKLKVFFPESVTRDLPSPGDVRSENLSAVAEIKLV